MSRLSTFLLGVVVGAVGILVSMNFYVVHANDGLHLVPKLVTQLEVPYVDIRKFGLQDWQQHQSLAVAIVKANKSELMTDSSLGSFKQATQDLLNRLGGAANGWR
jgi:hypothetical protein